MLDDTYFADLFQAFRQLKRIRRTDFAMRQHQEEYVLVCWWKDKLRLPSSQMESKMMSIEGVFNAKSTVKLTPSATR